MKVRGVLRIKNDAMLSWREARGLTQEDASRFCGVGRQVWGHLERLRYKRRDRGRVTPTCGWRTVEKIARATGIPASVIAPMEMWAAEDNIQTTFEKVADVPTAVLAAGRAQQEHLLLPDPSVEMQRSEALDALHRAVDTLPARERKVIEMRFGLNGKQESTFRQIGAAIGVTGGRAQKILYRAIRHLQHPARSRKILDATPGVTA